jgi:hypothetical protein
MSLETSQKEPPLCCETTFYGASCQQEAKFIVSGGVVRPHYTCAACARDWLSSASKDNPVTLEPIASHDPGPTS